MDNLLLVLSIISLLINLFEFSNGNEMELERCSRSSVPITVDEELFPSNSSSSSTKSSFRLFVDGKFAGTDDDVVVVVVIDGSSSALNKNEPVELTPLELNTLRNEFVLLNSLFAIVVASVLLLICPLFHDIRLIIAVDGVDFIDDGLIDDDDDDDGFVPCVPLPSAVKYRP